MKLGLFGLVAAGAIAVSAGSASAQPVVVTSPYAGPTYVAPAGPTYVAPAYPAYSPGVVVATPGLTIGGVYAPGGHGVVPGYRYGGYYGGYRGYASPYYYHNHHHGRW